MSFSTWPPYRLSFSRYCLFLIPLSLWAPFYAREIHFRFLAIFESSRLAARVTVVSGYALRSKQIIPLQRLRLISAISTSHRQRRPPPRSHQCPRGRTWWYEPEINYYRRRYKPMDVGI